MNRPVALLGHGGMPWAYPPSKRCQDKGGAPPIWPAVPLIDALDRRYAEDTWFQALTINGPTRWPRFSKQVLRELEPTEEEPTLAYAVLDLDRPDHRGSPWEDEVSAWVALDETISQLEDAGWTGAWGYATRGGLRIGWTLAEPIALRLAQSFLDQLHAALRPLDLPVSVDVGVKDWTRGYRVPWCPRKDGKMPAWGDNPPPLALDPFHGGGTLAWRPSELADETVPEPRTVDWAALAAAARSRTGSTETTTDGRIRPCVERWARQIAESPSRHGVLLAKCRALGGLCQGGLDRGFGTTPDEWVALLIAAAGDSNDAEEAAWDAINFGADKPWWFEEREKPGANAGKRRANVDLNEGNPSGPDVDGSTREAGPDASNDPPDDVYNGEDNGQAERGRAQILITSRADMNENLSIAAVANHPDVYQRSGLVRVTDDGLLHPLSPDALIPLLSSVADFVKVQVRDGKPVKVDGVPQLVTIPPPDQVARSIAKRGVWPRIRALDGVTRSPVLRPDGTVVAVPGYDQKSRLIYRPVGTIPVVPSSPTLDDARRALAKLADVVHEFPFATKADESAWLSLVLTLAARSVISGCVPFYAGIANQARTGKTTLLQYSGLIALGVWPAPIRWPSDEDELGKRVDALILGGVPLAIFDNLRNAIAGTALEAAITTTSYTPRILGKSTMPSCSQNAVFGATMNGGGIAGDMPGRTLPIRLHCPGPRPEQRSFKRANLRAYVEEHRVELHAAALTVVSAYLRAGSPDQGLDPWGSFEAWSAVIRSALVWAGQPDPCDARAGIDTIDLSGSTHDRLIACIKAVKTTSDWTAGDLADTFTAPGMASGHALGRGWTVRDVHHLAAELGVWDGALRIVDSRKLGEDLRGRIERPALNRTRIGYATYETGENAGKIRKHRTGVALYRLVGGPDEDPEGESE